ncbi:MAG: SIS domain-containing protein [Clostridiales bacterium]|uniref:Fructoselysine-6-P-deglycase FrlB-like protein n=1 Tax=Harryflintia acetispora TaxID=1849041 RepID=A0A9X8UK12_9FIRM|nr:MULTISPECIES: SIS domain-containing protein [Oscillospiraceae]PWM34341.1 MAG: SIS domain-containing protein [Clostridiales bacterium]RGB66303.1 SIS domain-containing protein [Harryflintia acetispora]TCL44149.1 fructoselysine-6-P-deglycase FrlB-like protein [Harryflintia acetispora]
MDAKKVISDILAEKKEIKDVYFVACGGSLVDLYGADYFIKAESSTIHSSFYTSKEFVLNPPKQLGEKSLAIVCSHSGNTPETVEAAHMAKDRGAAVITLTHAAGSGCDNDRFIVWVYPWDDDELVLSPMGITLDLMTELVQQQEGFAGYEHVKEGLGKISAIVKAARETVHERTIAFADKYDHASIIYTVGSGANWFQAYGLAICSLMEMQWMHASYIHSGEYFHGPFEVTEKGVVYYQMMSAGKNRPMDERSLKFIKEHTDDYVVVDAVELGLGAISEDVVDYFNPILFYAMSCEYRAALAHNRNHPLETRRYMGKVAY